MKDDKIRVKPFELLEINHFSMSKKENEHAVVSFSGRILAANEKPYMEMALDDIEAEVTVLQSMESEEMEEVLEEAKKMTSAEPLLFYKKLLKRSAPCKALT